MNKGFVNIILVIIVIALVIVAGYFVLIKKSSPALVNKTFSESEIIASLKANWQTIQASIQFRPAYHNQAEDVKKIWRAPTALQFIGKNNILMRLEDDNNVHVAIFHFDSGKFNLLEIFKNHGEFTLSDWQNLFKKYGNSSYPVSTYTRDLVRNGQIVSFQDLTKVPENIFVKNYWELLPTACTDQQEGAPVITSLSSYFGPVGTKLEIRGCNFAGFEGDLNAWVENNQGVKGILYGETGSTSKLLKISLASPLCQSDNSYSGLPCRAWLTLVPGTYKIYTTPWGKKSNEASFTIK